MRVVARSRKAWALVAIGTSALFGVWLVRASYAQTQPTSPLAAMARFAAVLTHIETSHIEPPNTEALIDGAIRGMVQTLDPHSVYLSPAEHQELMSDTAGHFAGIGVEIDWDDGDLVVASVMPESPALRAGLRSGDKFVAVDGFGVRDARIRDVVQRMRGEPGTVVEVSIRRAGMTEALQFRLTRVLIVPVAVEGELLSDGVAFVRVRSFTDNVSGQLQEILQYMTRLHRADLRGIVLDLRGNPGGLLHEAVAICDLFMSSGVIVSTRGRDGHVLSEMHASGPGTLSTPLVVLVNHYSASASEIVAAAIQDSHRGTVLGTQTWGKGSVQNVIELENGGALKLTTARYFAPSGRTIQALGVTPDITIEILPDATLQALSLHPPLSERSLEHHLVAQDAGIASPAVSSRDEVRVAGHSEIPRDTQAQAAVQFLTQLANHTR